MIDSIDPGLFFKMKTLMKNRRCQSDSHLLNHTSWSSIATGLQCDNHITYACIEASSVSSVNEYKSEHMAVTGKLPYIT